MTRNDRGSIMLLVIAYAAIGALALTVLVDASKYFLAQRALSAAADAAAATAAQAVDEPSLYAGTAPGAVPLSDELVRDAAGDYLQSASLDQHFDDLGFAASATDATTAVVQLHAVVHLPFAGILGGRFADGVAIHATARARSPYR